jgi:hypothetical protein
MRLRIMEAARRSAEHPLPAGAFGEVLALSGYAGVRRLLGIAAELVSEDGAVALPQELLGEVLGVHQQRVSEWIRLAMEHGLLEGPLNRSSYVKHQALEFTYCGPLASRSPDAVAPVSFAEISGKSAESDTSASSGISVTSEASATSGPSGTGHDGGGR